MMEAVDVFEQNRRLGRGINLGNALEAPNEGEWGLTLREEYFRIIKARGFSSVRVPIRWSAHTSSESPFAIDSTFFARVDWVIDQALKNDLMVIINMHHYEEIFRQPAVEKAKFLAMWRQIAQRYANEPAEVLFELLNEPHDQLTADLWNQLLDETLSLVRESNPYRTIFVGAAEWGGLPGLKKLVLPEDSNIIVTVHYYEPFQFTHQGAEWVDGANAWLGTQWNAQQDEISEIRDHFQEIVNWAQTRNIPINIGEFGAYSKADQASRARWTREIVRFALENNMSFHYWEFGSGFGVFNPNTNTWYTDLMNALLNTEAGN
jgi:endoglucanase